MPPLMASMSASHPAPNLNPQGAGCGGTGLYPAGKESPLPNTIAPCAWYRPPGITLRALPRPRPQRSRAALSRFSVNNGFRHLHSPSNGTPQMSLPLARGTLAGMQLCMGLRKRRRRHHCSGCQICSGSRVGSSGTVQHRQLGRDSACAFRHTSPRDARRLVGHGQMHVQPAESRPVKPPPVPTASVLGVSAAPGS